MATVIKLYMKHPDDISAAFVKYSIKTAGPIFEKDRCTFVMTHAVPSQPPPPLSSVWGVLEAETDLLKLASAQSHDAAAAREPMLAALQSICDLGSSLDLDLAGGLTDIWHTSCRDEWRSRVSSLCGRVRKEWARRRRSSRNAGIRFYIQQRHIEALRAEQG